MPSNFRKIAELRATPRSVVYEHGWQSWSPTGAYRAMETSPRAGSPQSHTMGYRPGRPAPETGFQGEGMLAVDAGDGSPVMIWSTPNASSEVPSIRLEVERGYLVVSADGKVTENAYPTNLQSALALWADQFAERSAVGRVASLPALWCTWYQYWQQVTEGDVLENLEAIDRLGLNVGIVQLDDGYQAEVGDWLARSPRFPRPLVELVDRIGATGRRAGIWTAPLLVGTRSRLATEYPAWLVSGADAGFNWGQSLGVLDVTHPAAAAHLQNVFRTLSDWGFDFFKIDFMYAGALEGRRHADCTATAAYREALRLIREAVGPEATLLGCGAPLLPSVGMVDAMRVSPDIALHFEPEGGDLSKPSQRSAVLGGCSRAFQNGRLWLNDPDCLIARPEMEGRESWAAHIGRVGGLRGSSDRLNELDSWGLETTRRLLKPAPTEPLTADAGEVEPDLLTCREVEREKH